MPLFEFAILAPIAFVTSAVVGVGVLVVIALVLEALGPK